MKQPQWTILFLIPFLSISCNAADEPVKANITVNQIKNRDYYHLKYDLHKNNLVESKKNLRFSEGGMFEVRLSKEQFPVPAPKCKKHLILRMPWTDPVSSNAVTHINKKRELYNRIQNIGGKRIEVTIELNPYVKRISENPLQLELTRCNIFFRHKKGQYIDD